MIAPCRAALSLILALTAGPTSVPDAPEGLLLGPVQEGAAMLGQPAPGLDSVQWLDGRPHPLADERGRPVLLRWWTTRCGYCVNSAAALRVLDAEFGDQLAIRSIYHAKPRSVPVTAEATARAAEALGLPGRIGFDAGWQALRKWWFEAAPRSYTSVTFLIDASGKVAAVHTGTEFHGPEVAAEECRRRPEQCHADMAALTRQIRLLLPTKESHADRDAD